MSVFIKAVQGLKILTSFDPLAVRRLKQMHNKCSILNGDTSLVTFSFCC